MGKIAVKTETGWLDGIPYVRLASGWARAKKVFRKTGANTWSTLMVVDSTPPGVPVVTQFEREGSRLKITIKAPADADVVRLRVKVGKRIASSLEIDADYISSPDGTDSAWSEWTVAPGQTRTKYFPVAGTLTFNTQYYVTAWALDTSKNWSNPATASVRYTMPEVIPPKGKSASISCVESTTYRRQTREYYRGNDNTYIGGTYNSVGLYYYSGKITAQLKNAKTLDRVQIRLQRFNDWGYKGPVQFRLLAHTMTGYSKVNIDDSGRIVYASVVDNAAQPGQTVTLDIPEDGTSILSGKIKGFGIYSQLSSGNDNIDIYEGKFYGEGTSSGRVYLEYTE